MKTMPKYGGKTNTNQKGSMRKAVLRTKQGNDNMAENLRMDTVELLNQVGVLAFINGGEEGKALYNAFVTGRVCYEVYKRLSVSQADVLRAETIMRISEYVKSHPRASESQLKAEVEKEIKLFAQKIAELEAVH